MPVHRGPVSCRHPEVLGLGVPQPVPSWGALSFSCGGVCAGEDDVVCGLPGHRGKSCLESGELGLEGEEIGGGLWRAV